jgi:hypothetical protein
MSIGNAPIRNVIVIENSTIDALAGNEAFRREFPGLAGIVRPRPIVVGKCGRCRKRQKATLAEYRAFKNTLAALGPEDKIRFKQFLGCKQVRVVHVNPANRVIDRTF